jgi:hypothetical protein
MRRETVAFTGQPGPILSAAREIAAEKGWKVSSESGNELEIKTKVSAKSWGETVKVRVDWNQVAGTLLVTVSSSARLQAFDWGKSADNVGALMGGLKQRFQGGQPFQATPSRPAASAPGFKFCANCGTRLAAGMQFCTKCGQRAE